MAILPFFVSVCASCNRKAEIKIDRLGRETKCQHCGKSFVAQDRDNQSAAVDDPLNYWIRFTDHHYAKPEFEMIPGKDLGRVPR